MLWERMGLIKGVLRLGMCLVGGIVLHTIVLFHATAPFFIENLSSSVHDLRRVARLELHVVFDILEKLLNILIGDEAVVNFFCRWMSMCHFRKRGI